MRILVWGGLAVACIAVAACGANGEEAPGASAGGAERPCGGNPPYRERWREFSGGPTDGPVTLAIGPEAAEAGLPLTRAPDGERLLVKVLILVDAPAGTRVAARTRALGRGEARLTHFVEAGSWASAWTATTGAVPDRGQSPGTRPADLPGYVYATRPGCYELRIRVGDEPEGIFFLRLRAPG